MQIRKTYHQRLTYGQGPASCGQYLLQSSTTGLRITTRHFDGEPTVEVQLIYGDGRTPKFRAYLSRHVTPDLVAATVTEFAAQAAEQHALKKPGYH